MKNNQSTKKFHVKSVAVPIFQYLGHQLEPITEQCVEVGK